MSKNTTLYPVAYRGFSSNSLLTITSNIEKTVNIDSSVYYTDVIFLTFKKSDRTTGKMTYNKESESAKLDSINLRALALGIKNSLKIVSNYGTGNENNLYRDRTATKEFYLSFENNKFYLNIKDLSKTKSYIGVEIEKFKLLSLADSMIIIADTTEKYLYSFQRDSKEGNGENK